jgi:hypothetical protein
MIKKKKKRLLNKILSKINLHLKAHLYKMMKLKMRKTRKKRNKRKKIKIKKK